MKEKVCSEARSSPEGIRASSEEGSTRGCPRNLSVKSFSRAVGLVMVGLTACSSDSKVILTDCDGAESSFPLPVSAVSVERAQLFAGDTQQDLSFGAIQDIAVDAAGRIYVLDSMNRRVSVHDSNGRTLLAFGSEGEGPGEFQYPTRLFLASPDTLKVFDALLLRVTSFSSSGEVLETVNPPAEPRFGQDQETRFASSGELYKLSYEGFQESLLFALGDEVKGVVRGRNAIKKWEHGRKDWQTVIEVPGLEVFVDLEESAIRDVPFAKRPLWALAHEALWYADNARYELKKYTSEGVEVCQIRVSWNPMRTSRRERELYFAAQDLVDDSRFSERDVNRIREQRESIPYPDYKPAISSLVVAENGDVWINPIDGSAASSDTRWHVLSPTGRPRGMVELHRRFQPLFIVDDRIYGRELGELDVHQVAEYRLGQEQDNG